VPSRGSLAGMRRLLFALGVVGCASATRGVEPQPQVAAEPEATPAESQPVEARSDSPASLPEPWWTPLPPLSLEPQEQAEVEGTRDCQAQLARASSPQLLLGVAECFHAARAFGREAIVLQKVVTERGADTDATQRATRQLARLMEQVGREAQALEWLESYLRLFPKAEDARMLGQRGVCLAWKLEMENRQASMLTMLSRAYGRDGFVVPPSVAMRQLCGGRSAPG